MSKRWLYLKYFAYVTMAITGIIFDDVNSSRIIVLIGLLTLLGILNIARDKYSTMNPYIQWSYLIDAGIVLFIELNSRYVVNYFFHIFYIFILIEILVLMNKNAISVSVMVSLASMYKFIRLIIERRSFGSISETLFFLFVNILIIVSGALNHRYRVEKNEKEKIYVELLETTRELEKITRDSERIRISRDIHDTLGHEMTAMIMQLEMASRLIEKDTLQTKDIIESAKRAARESLSKVREIVESLREPHSNLELDIRQLILKFGEQTGLMIEYKLDGDFVKLKYKECLYFLIQESLTNTSRHSDSKEIKIELVSIGQKMKFKIKDQGTHHDENSRGYGLKGMIERVNQCDGKIDIYFDKGFVIEGYLPLGGLND